MPTYAYRCVTCGQTIDIFQPITAEPLTQCLESVCAHPETKGQGKLERIITGGAGVIFNGSGFYITDYKRSIAPSESGQSSSGGTSCASGSCSCRADE